MNIFEWNEAEEEEDENNDSWLILALVLSSLCRDRSDLPSFDLNFRTQFEFGVSFLFCTLFSNSHWFCFVCEWVFWGQFWRRSTTLSCFLCCLRCSMPKANRFQVLLIYIVFRSNWWKNEIYEWFEFDIALNRNALVYFFFSFHSIKTHS